MGASLSLGVSLVHKDDTLSIKMIHPCRLILLICSITTLFQAGNGRIGISAGSQVGSTSKDSITDQKRHENELGDIWSMVAAMGASEQATADETGGYSSGGFEWQLNLDDDDKYRLDWTVRYSANEIAFAININEHSSGFRPGRDIFALGFSQYGDLQSSDFCLFWYDLGHQLHLQDAITDSSGRLRLVESSQSHCNLSSISGREPKFSSETRQTEAVESAARTRLLFTRPLDVCDQRADLHYYGIDNGTTHLVWFTLTGPVLSIDGLNLVQLSSMPKSNAVAAPEMGRLDWGMRRAQLVATRATGSRTRAGKMSVDMTMAKFKIPAQETTYWCKLFKLAHKFEQRRYHMTKYEAVVEPGNEHVVHHMELFNCANLSPENRQALDDLTSAGWEGDCNGAQRPKATRSCRRVVAAWAMGAHPLEYPEQAGQSIGGHNYSPYLMLEVHYNNIHSTGGLIDSSGIRFHYVSRLRKYDAGIMEVGLEYTDKNSIPPNLVTPLAGYCVSECTRTAISRSMVTEEERGELEDGIYIFAGQLHTHLTGVASWTELVREGRLVGEIQRDNHYSPHFQEIRLLAEPVHVAPGDAMIHYCLYDTRKRTNITLGGYATSDEMCVTYLHYYPRTELEVCKSSVDSEALEAYFAYLAREEGQSTSSRLSELHPEEAEDTIGDGSRGRGGAKSVAQNYRSIEWTRRRARELLQFYSRAPLSVQCNHSDGRRFAGHWNGITPTRLWADLAGSSPMESRLPTSEQLLGYRGRDPLAGRHAHCDQRQAGQLSPDR